MRSFCSKDYNMTIAHGLIPEGFEVLSVEPKLFYKEEADGGLLITGTAEKTFYTETTTTKIGVTLLGGYRKRILHTYLLPVSVETALGPTHGKSTCRINQTRTTYLSTPTTKLKRSATNSLTSSSELRPRSPK